MATTQDLIKRARRLVGALGRGETPSDVDNVDGLASLNAMLDQWSIDRYSVYRILEETVTVSTITHTIGPSGDTVTTRPIELESAVHRQNDVDYPISILNDKQYRAITFKTVTSTLISEVFLDPVMPNATLYVYPVPVSPATLLLRSRAQLGTLTINETIVLPPGYEDAITHNLAVRLAPEYQRSVPQSVAWIASSTLKNIRKINYRIPQSQNEIGGRYNIYSDEHMQH